jgi:2,5-diamino-6-(ribosylamino)-4(3H)-pyrimidinone 5'-phosphate reductase
MKPYVICHMCTTIDGRILGARWGKLPGRKSSSALFETTADRFGISAWLVGTTTMHEFAGRSAKLRRARRRIKRTDHIADSKAKRFAIGADARGTLRFKRGDVDGDHVVLLVTEQVTTDYLAHLQAAGVSYLFCGTRHIDLRVALDKLRRTLGLRKVMLEGGGKFNGSMLNAGLIDEISQVVVPVVDGGIGISGIFDIPGEPPKRAAAMLRLKSHERLPGGVSWFRYRVVGKPGR